MKRWKTGEESVASEAEDDALLSALMQEFAKAEGERYLTELKRLQEDPHAAVPPAVTRKMLELIERELQKRSKK